MPRHRERGHAKGLHPLCSAGVEREMERGRERERESGGPPYAAVSEWRRRVGESRGVLMPCDCEGERERGWSGRKNE